MNEFLQFLNQNSGALMVIFTAVVTISTVVYAFLTARLTEETRRMRKIQTEPKIEVSLKPREEFVNIVNIYIKNIGLGPAYEITFEITIEAGDEGANELIKDFTKPNFFNTGLSYLGPGQEVLSGFSQMNKMYDKKIESALNFKIQYKGIAGDNYEDQFRIDFSEFKGTSKLGKPNLYSIAKSFEKLQKDIGHIVSGFKRIRAEVYTSEDREKERKEQEDYLEQLKNEQNSDKK